MKKITLLAAFIVISAGLLTSCDKAKSLVPATSVDWDGVDVTITIPPISDTTPHTSMGVGSFSFNLDSFLKAKTNNTIGADNIDRMEIISCDMQVTNPDSANNFRNFKSAQVYISSDSKSGSSMIAENVDNPDVYAATMVCAIVPKTVLKDYFNKSGPTVIHYTVGGQLRTATTHDNVMITRVRIRIIKD